MNKLPDNWSQCEIGEVTQIVSGGTPPSRDPTNFVEDGGIPWITPADLSGYNEVFITRGARNLSQKGFESCSARKLPAGSVLFSSRAPIGHVAIAANELTTNQGFRSFVLPEGLDSRFIYYYLRYAIPVAEKMATGTTFKELSGSKVARLPLLIAPYQEQKRIADKLDTLLARVDACQAQLDRVARLLDQFRQAVLAIAGSGQIVGSAKADVTNPPSLPLGKVVGFLKTGPFGSALHKSDYILNGVPVINPMHIIDGRIIPAENHTVSEDKAEELEKYRLMQGDIVLARRGAMGRCAVVGNKEHGWVCGSGSMIIRVNDLVLPGYLQIFLSSPRTASILNSKAVGSTMTNLNQRILSSLSVPVPSIPTQLEIVRIVRTLFSFADCMETQYQNAYTRIEHLTPALLNKAFRGELAPQYPNDEPASVLLERLRAEQAAKAEKPKRVTTRKPRRTRMTEESVKDTIRQLPEDMFSFDDLRSVLAGDYEQLKTILFILLNEADPSISQVFDQSSRAIRFVRSAK